MYPPKFRYVRSATTSPTMSTPNNPINEDLPPEVYNTEVLPLIPPIPSFPTYPPPPPPEFPTYHPTPPFSLSPPPPPPNFSATQNTTYTPYNPFATSYTPSAYTPTVPLSHHTHSHPRAPSPTGCAPSPATGFRSTTTCCHCNTARRLSPGGPYHPANTHCRNSHCRHKITGCYSCTIFSEVLTWRCWACDRVNMLNSHESLNFESRVDLVVEVEYRGRGGREKWVKRCRGCKRIRGSESCAWEWKEG